jgi:hypothetical protein
VAERLGLAELELCIAVLPPLSRGFHLDGPRLHAERLVKLWAVEDDIALGEAFRLLPVDALADVILRTVVAADPVRHDPRHWTFPTLAAMLPELQQATWQEIMAGRLQLTAIKGMRGKVHRIIPPKELVRLAPDWSVGRLIQDGRDEYIDVRCRRMSAPSAKPWSSKALSRTDLRAATEAIAHEQPPGTKLTFAKFQAALHERLGRQVPQKAAREAMTDWAPQLKLIRGYRDKN